jgi:uncharacterized cupin superfamily protein
MAALIPFDQILSAGSTVLQNIPDIRVQSGREEPTMSAFSIAAQLDGSNPDFVAAPPESVHLEDAPIEAGWIVSGSPVARSGLHSESRDGKASTSIWECSAGAFWWTFHNEETVVILEGEVRVTSQSGEKKLLKKGDIAYFSRDSKALWEIDRYVRKIAFVRHRHSRQVLALRRMLRLLKGGKAPALMSPPLLGALAAMLPL